MKKLILTLILTSVLFGLSLAGEGIVITDGLGRELFFEKTPQRIITTIPSTTEIMFSLGLNEKIVGVTSLTQYLSYVPDIQRKAEEKEKIGGFFLDLEKIVALEPDLVVMDATQKGILPKLEELGLKIYVTAALDIDDIMESILELGQITGALDRAKWIVGDMAFKRVRLKEEVERLERKVRAFYVIDSTIFTAGENTFLGRALKLAGLVNVFADIDGFKPVSDEVVVERDPEVIIVAAGAGVSVEDLKKRFFKVKAIKEGNIIFLTEEEASMLSQPGTKIVDGIIRLFERVYGRSPQLEQLR
jgi:iron complex transport system substrate-binding protein